MRITKIEIDHWRHFRNFTLAIDEQSKLICIVGANGTGKSQLLDLIAACATNLGLSHGMDTPRGNPLGDPHRFKLHFHLSPEIIRDVEDHIRRLDIFDSWDRTVIVDSEKTSGVSELRLRVGGIRNPDDNKQLAAYVTNAIRKSQDVHFLSVDSDRAYPKMNISIATIAEASEINWSESNFTRGRSFRSTAFLYDEWIKYCLSIETQAGNRLIQEHRRHQRNGVSAPNFRDHFSPYRDALSHVLPHVTFIGADLKTKTLLFESSGHTVSFDQLSGGEREIAYLIGQIDRFKLTQGLFLIDEPELHLNADLVRTWVRYLAGTVDTGQIWLATHSLEAVESAGESATFVLERNKATREVDRATRLDARPLLSQLSRAVGTPAFAISQLAFVYVEGEPRIEERERFNQLSGYKKDFRFIPCGSGNEVRRQVSVVNELATESPDKIRVGGVIDRDFKKEKEIKNIVDSGIYVLEVHEVENFFLHPFTLNFIAKQNGKYQTDVLKIICNASDLRAGSWIFQYTMASPNARSLPEIPLEAKNKSKKATWTEIECDQDAYISDVTNASQYDAKNASVLSQIVKIGIKAYDSARKKDCLWKKCEGKQVLSQISLKLGFSGPAALEAATFVAWEQKKCAIPEELTKLLSYISKL